MKKTFQYRIYPTKSQIRKLSDMIRSCRFVWNTFLNERKVLYENEKKQLSTFAQLNRLPELKQEFPFLKNTYSQTLQAVGNSLGLAFKSFFRRLKNGETAGYPRFKGINRLSSISFPQYGKCGCFIKNGKLAVSKIGDVKIIYHRELIGIPKTATIKRTSTGKWFVNIVCDYEPLKLKERNNSVGIDLGISTFATFSDGNKIENPYFLKTEESLLKKAQSKTDKQNKGSKEHKKARKVVNRIYERISWKRDNFLHKESRKIINNYQKVIFERLIVKKMLENHLHKLNKFIMDVAWYKFTKFVEYKAEEAGRTICFVNPMNTTKICSQCGKIVDKSLNERTHKCVCGLIIDRDLNAAINILRMGTHSL